MLIKQYAAFVSRTDQFSEKYPNLARDIAINGLVSEIGSIVSAIKKEALNEGGALSSSFAKAELTEELGDAMWYAFALARIEDDGGRDDILLRDIENLRIEIQRNDARGARIRQILPKREVASFLSDAEAFNHSRRTLSNYQHLAFRTARTHGDTLLTVCTAVLTQLGAQLMRHLLPDIELELNQQLQHRPIEVILGEIAWHLCAIASLYEIDMDEVAKVNDFKASAREKRDDRRTALHDENFPDNEQLPRKFCIEFKTVSPGVSQMYWDGNELGDPLKDQNFEPDGYRFHDVMHLSNAACLGWSPVLRDLMSIKRRSCDETKNAQDGGRAAVVEELVIKFIHWEASRRAKALHENLPAEERPLFPADEQIPFSVLKQAREFTFGLEVYTNKYWEWEQAIREGYRVFQKLRRYKSGYIHVDLNARSLRYEAPNTPS